MFYVLFWIGFLIIFIKVLFYNFKRIDSRITGLQLGSIINNFLIGSEDLHYGYFKESDINDKKTLNITHFKQAQTNYSNLIIDSIPTTTKNILDVGAGCGTIASKLLEKDYLVDCVSPDIYLSNKIVKNTNNNVYIYNSIFEKIDTTKKYDLILFSESFQYINIDIAFKKIDHLLTNNGTVIICDFFKKDLCKMKGGHIWTDFQNKVNNNPNLTLIKKTDITNETSLTHEIIVNVINNLCVPFYKISSVYLNGNYPILSYLMNYINFSNFKNKIEKLKLEDSNYFIKNKYYYLLIYKKI